MTLGIPEDFDPLPAMRNALLPENIPVEYSPTSAERLLAAYACDPELSIEGACRKLGIKPSTYRRWRKKVDKGAKESSPNTYGAWLDAYLDLYDRNAERFAQRWFRTRGVGILTDIAHDKKASPYARVAAMRELRQVADQTPIRPPAEAPVSESDETEEASIPDAPDAPEQHGDGATLRLDPDRVAELENIKPPIAGFADRETRRGSAG